MHMEEKQEHISGPMLIAKCVRLTSGGWVPNFCQIYGLKEFRQHGEAGSVNLEAVEKEQEQIRKIYAEYAPEDNLNFNDAPPDRGIVPKQMLGKKSNKFHITVGFICNATGTEKWPIIYIGKSKQPHYFAKRSPTDHGWIKYYNKVFRDQNRKVCLWLDNFSGHTFTYKPTNIRMELFEPTMISFVQPLDAGIIRCFKAHYQCAFCLHAIELDEAGEDNIYKVNQLEVMLMAKDAWVSVSTETIQNCWKHTFAMSCVI
ncbi:hypothetical protein BS17DRAFT_796059 [Gyrodon lividus]|nr:hypothetical protein BS17DRAFT_796059 [Gyrodon lividus]